MSQRREEGRIHHDQGKHTLQPLDTDPRVANQKADLSPLRKGMQVLSGHRHELVTSLYHHDPGMGKILEKEPGQCPASSPKV